MYVREVEGGRAAKVLRSSGFAAKAISHGMTTVEEAPPLWGCRRVGTIMFRGGLLNISWVRASTSEASTVAEGGQVKVIVKKEAMGQDEHFVL